jgi:hypothetical protein
VAEHRGGWDAAKSKLTASLGANSAAESARGCDCHRDSGAAQYQLLEFVDSLWRYREAKEERAVIGFSGLDNMVDNVSMWSKRRNNARVVSGTGTDRTCRQRLQIKACWLVIMFCEPSK